MLQIITDTPTIRLEPDSSQRDLGINIIKEEIRHYNRKYSVRYYMFAHPNMLAAGERKQDKD